MMGDAYMELFEAGAIVTLTRSDVMYVATEYGVANLRGKSIRQREQELIGIAHPTSGASCATMPKR